jgi:ribokinase
MLLTPEEIETARPMIKNAKVLICQLEISVKTTIAALRIGREEGICTILNTAPAPKEFDPDLFKYADIVSPNESEAELITGMTINDVESATVASKKILEMGAKMVVMTLGEKGSLLVTPDAVEHVACPKVKAIDTGSFEFLFFNIIIFELSFSQYFESNL